MFSLLVVDDEAIERKALIKMIADGAPYVTVVGEAVNGRQAIDLARQLKPDIITMDIKMPGIDGVEAVQQILQEQPDIKCIMVSAFDTFDYARQVMAAGVKHYLLKPSKEEEILQTIARVVDEINQTRSRKAHLEQLEVSLNKALSFVQSEWIATLLLDHVQETSEWEKFLNPGARQVYAAVCRVELNSEDKDHVHRTLCDWFRGQVKGYVGPFFGDIIPIFVFVSDDNGLSPQAEAVQMTAALLKHLRAVHRDGSFRIGLGLPVDSANDFLKSYNEALVALDATSDGVNYLYFHPSLETVEAGGGFEKEKALLSALKSGDRDGLLRAFYPYFNELITKHHHDVTRIAKSIDELWVIASRLLHDMGVSFHFQGVEPQASINQLRNVVKDQLLQVAVVLDQWKSRTSGGAIHKAEVYIKDHFHLPLTLEEVARHIGLSPYYFSKLFKEKVGMTFVDYLTKIRMNQAKMLIASTDRSLKEICFEVGYKDPNYFSRVFKKWVKVSPKKYREVPVTPRKMSKD
ncbi:response regulator [Camelliibacillus cellulosilyticus]|uniref:Response regulator n=1 Tax=Camelliibacillus cellulosilyticus TaxID=2174486 RepID=A0ABV9GP44_9BACL